MNGQESVRAEPPGPRRCSLDRSLRVAPDAGERRDRVDLQDSRPADAPYCQLASLPSSASPPSLTLDPLRACRPFGSVWTTASQSLPSTASLTTSPIPSSPSSPAAGAGVAHVRRACRRVVVTGPDQDREDVPAKRRTRAGRPARFPKGPRKAAVTAADPRVEVVTETVIMATTIATLRASAPQRGGIDGRRSVNRAAMATGWSSCVASL